MQAPEFMTTDVLTVRPEDPVKEVAARLVERQVTAAPVVDADGRLVGIVSEADLLPGRLEPDPRRHLRPAAVDAGPLAETVGAVMTGDVVALPPTADEADFARLMVAHRVKSIPVVADGRVVGIVSRRDLLRTLSRDDQALRAEVLARLSSYTGSRVPWEVDVRDSAVTVTGPPDEPQRRVAELLVRTVPGVARVTVETAPRPVVGTLDHGGLRVLGLTECLERLRSTPLGRLAFVADGDPVILPVNHGVDGTDVVFRTAPGTKLFAAEKATSVAFETDGYDPARRTGWSVLVRGIAEAVYEDEVIERLDRLGVDPWADAVDRPVWVRVRSEEVSGREIAR